MSEHGAALQTYNQELVKCLEQLKIKKHTLLDIIDKEESEKLVLERNITILQDKLSELNSNLREHKTLCDHYEKTINETENGFKKILETSQALLHLAQHEATKLGHKKCEQSSEDTSCLPINTASKRRTIDL